MLTIGQQTILVLKVGETISPAGLLAANVAAMATQYDGLDAKVAPLGPSYSLERLYTERDLVLIAMGAARANVHMKTGDQEKNAEQEAARLQAMYQNCMGEISRLEKMAGSGPPQVGQILQTAPSVNPFPGIDANDPALRGDPYRIYPATSELLDSGLPVNTQQ